MSKLKSAIEEYKRWGLIRFFHLTVMTTVRPWFVLTSITSRPIYSSPTLPELAPNREVRVATREDLEAVADDPLYEMDQAFIDAALARGELCVAAFENGKMIAYVWRAFGPTPHTDGLWVDFDRQYRYGFKAFTHPDYRQQRLQHAIGLLTDPLMIERGYYHSIGFVETHNFPSLISDKKRGHKIIGYAGYFKLFGKVIPFRTPGAKKRGFRFFVPDEGE